MKQMRALMMLMIGLALSACASVDTATRNAPIETAPVAQHVSFQPVSYNVVVPETLKVSEANSYFPLGDIVWRGDAPGNRYEQIAAIFGNSMTQGAANVQGTMPVRVEIEVKRFHALTEKTRYTVGGVHSITFDITLRDPETGAIIRAPREVKANLLGYGGQQAIEADTKGLTQKYRITTHLAKVLRDEMTLATGYVQPRGGVTKRISPI